MLDIGCSVRPPAAELAAVGGGGIAEELGGSPEQQQQSPLLPSRARFMLGSWSDDADGAAAGAATEFAVVPDDADLHRRICALSRALSLLRVELLNMRAQDEELTQQFSGIGRAIQQLRQQPPSSPSCDSTEASFSDAGSVFGSDVDLEQLHDTCEIEFRARTSSLLLGPVCGRRGAGIVLRRKMCVSFDESSGSSDTGGVVAATTGGHGRIRVAR